VIVGDLLDLDAVHRAVDGCKRLYFSMSVNERYLEATTNVAAVAGHHGVEAFVNMSQVTVSEMSIRETARSPQHKQHWLAEQVLRWSGLPVVTMRPTAFMDAFFWRFAVPTVTAQDALVLGRPITYMDIPLERWLESLQSIGAFPHVVAHLESMALLHRDGRYDRSSGDVNLLTGMPPVSIEDFVRAHQNDFLKADARKP
jgi:uncharacterized protein YbjT (DUF2867 family)